MFKVLLAEVFLKAEREHIGKNLKASSTQIIGTTPLAEDDTRLNNPFVDASSIGKVCPSFGSRKCIMRFIEPILHDGLSPEPR